MLYFLSFCTALILLSGSTQEYLDVYIDICSNSHSLISRNGLFWDMIWNHCGYAN